MPAFAVAVGAVLLIAGAASASAPTSKGDPAPEKLRMLAAKGVHTRVRATAAEDDPNRLGPGGLPRASSSYFTLTAGLAPSVRDERAGLTVNVPPLRAVFYLYPPRIPANGYLRAPSYWLPERPDPSCDYYINDFGGDLYVVDVDQPDPDKQGTIRSVGVFPDTNVSALAFGSVPLTATLHVSELSKDGKVQPLIVDWSSTAGKSVPKGASSDDPGGCDATWDADQSQSTVVSGQVMARVSDVRVDGHVIDVGPNCHAATPLQLHLNGLMEADGGNYVLTDHGLLVQAKDRRIKNPANPVPVAPGSRNLTIPPFTGCVGKSGEDLSTLVTNIVSTTDAALGVNQAVANVNFFDPIDNVTVAAAGLPPHAYAPVPGR